MIPRLSYEMDEIEMELKGAEMLYRCDHAKNCGDPNEPCFHRREHERVDLCALGCKGGAKCIPVEPERVSDHTYAQRAGMLERAEERDWFIMSVPKCGNAGFMLSCLVTRAEAEARMSRFAKLPDHNYAMFRWSSGERG